MSNYVPQAVEKADSCAHAACEVTETGAYCPECGVTWHDVGTDKPYRTLPGGERQEMEVL